jgi:hypothetical protein
MSGKWQLEFSQRRGAVDSVGTNHRVNQALVARHKLKSTIGELTLSGQSEKPLKVDTFSLSLAFGT